MYIDMNGREKTHEFYLKQIYCIDVYNIQLIAELTLYKYLYDYNIELLQCRVIDSKSSEFLDLWNNNEQLQLTF